MYLFLLELLVKYTVFIYRWR